MPPPGEQCYFRRHERRLYHGRCRHAIIPVMLGMPNWLAEMASRMLDAGIYVVGFSFPVVPRVRRDPDPDVRRPCPGATGQGRSMPSFASVASSV